MLKGINAGRCLGTSVDDFIMTGLRRDGEARRRLAQLYQETRSCLARLPDCYYRETLGQTLQERLLWLQDERLDVNSLEQRLGEGRLEEMVLQAEAEKQLVQRMETEWRPWEPLESPPPEKQWD